MRTPLSEFKKVLKISVKSMKHDCKHEKARGRGWVKGVKGAEKARDSSFSSYFSWRARNGDKSERRIKIAVASQLLKRQNVLLRFSRVQSRILWRNQDKVKYFYNFMLARRSQGMLSY